MDACKKLDSPPMGMSSITAEADTSAAAGGPGGGGGGAARRAARVKRESITVPEAKDADCGDEPADFIETNCHWRDCGIEFGTQDDLVKVSNQHRPPWKQSPRTMTINFPLEALPL